MSQLLRLAVHAEADAYWSGGEYELNLSFGTLRDKQWQRVIETVWTSDAVSGPFDRRYVPGVAVNMAPVQIPPPTATLTQYGGLTVSVLDVGCAVLVTRSLFECVTLQVPLGMFDGVPVDGRGTPRIEALDHIYQDIALDVFDYVPFDLATIGFQSGCCLFAELQADEQQCFDLLNAGSIFARDDVLRALNVWPDDYPAARPGLRWIPPGY